MRKLILLGLILVAVEATHHRSYSQKSYSSSSTYSSGQRSPQSSYSSSSYSSSSQVPSSYYYYQQSDQNGDGFNNLDNQYEQLQSGGSSFYPGKSNYASSFYSSANNGQEGAENGFNDEEDDIDGTGRRHHRRKYTKVTSTTTTTHTRHPSYYTYTDSGSQHGSNAHQFYSSSSQSNTGTSSTVKSSTKVVPFKMRLVGGGSVTGKILYRGADEHNPDEDEEIAKKLVYGQAGIHPVGLYEHSDHSGRGMILAVPEEQCINLPSDFNDVISSVNTFGKCFYICEHHGCFGNCLKVAPGIGDSRFIGHNYNDLISSVKQCSL